MKTIAKYLLHVLVLLASLTSVNAQFFVEYCPRFAIYSIRGQTYAGNGRNVLDPRIDLSEALSKLRMDFLSAGIGYRLSDDMSIVMDLCSSGEIQHSCVESGWMFPTRYLGAGGNVVDTIISVTDRYAYSQMVQYLFIEPQFRMKLTEKLAFRAGVSVGVLLASHRTNTIQLVHPDNVTWKMLPDSLIVRTGHFDVWPGPLSSVPLSFRNDDREIVFEDTDSPEFTSVRFGLELGLQYSIALTDTFFLVPNISYQYGVNSHFGNGDPGAISILRLGASLQMDL